MKSVRKCSRATAVAVALTMGAVLLPGVAGAAPPDGADGSAGYVETTAGERSAAARTTEAANITRPDFAVTPCPEITDSIVRLYSAYFLRAPDEGGFMFWWEQLFTAQWSLPRMSQFFSESPEFQQRYGALTDAQFIDLIYQNIFGRPADAGGRDFWLGRMANEGLTRGTVMLNFSESPEYVDLSDTWFPAAGYFNWYPDGTEMFCGFDVEIEYGFPQTPVYVDSIVYNHTAAPITVTIERFTGGAYQPVQEATIDPGIYLTNFGRGFLDDSVTGLRISSRDEFNWILAYSPVPLPTTRVGWEAV